MYPLPLAALRCSDSQPLPHDESGPSGSLPNHARRLRFRATMAGMIVLLSMGTPLSAQENPGPEVDEDPATLDSWTIPWTDAHPTALAATPSGVVWFIEEGRDHLGVLEPGVGQIHRFILPEGTGPTGVEIGPGGFPWFVGGVSGILGRLDPESGQVLRYELPDPLGSGGRLAAGPEGLLWFTAADAEGMGFLGRMNPSDGDMVARGFDEPLSGASGLAVDPDGAPWVGLGDSGGLVRLEPESMDAEHIERAEGPGSLVVDGGIWWLDPERGAVVRLDPSTGETDEWPVAADWAPAYLVGTSGGDQASGGPLVLVAGEAPIVARTFDPVSGALGEPVELPLEAGIVTAIHLDGSTGTLWVGTDRGELARVTIGSAPTP